jgi:copper resistance protein D
VTGGMEEALVAVRLVQFGAAMVLFGAPVFALALALRYRAGTAVRLDFDRWLRRCLLIAAIAALVSAALWLDLEAGIMGNGWDQALDPDTVELVLFDTVFGRAWCWHIGFGVAVLAVAAAAPARTGTTALVALLAASFVASLAWAGHAVMHPGVSRLLVQVTHLLAGGLWLGSLPALFHVVTQARRDRSAEWQGALHYMLPLYSRAGYVAVGLVLVTGILNSWFLVASVGKLATTSFGQVLVAKVALVLLMVSIAAINRFVLQPKIMTSREGRESREAARALRRSVALELGTGVFVLAAVSLLGTLPPAMAMPS